MDPCDNTYRSWLLADPKAFVAGVRGFCKQAQYLRLYPGSTDYEFATTRGNRMLSSDDPDYGRAMRLKAMASSKSDAEDESLWSKIKPWVIGLGIGYAGLKGGEWWGRYAQSRGYREGPVKGPLVAALNGFLPKRLDVRPNTSGQPPLNGQAYF